MLKPLKILDPRHNYDDINLGMQFFGLKFYEFCLNNEPWLTLTYFKQNIFADMFE